MSKKLFFLLGFTLFLSLVGSLQAEVIRTTKDPDYPGADTYVGNDSQVGPTSNRGGENRMRIRQNNASRSKVSYIRFDINEVAGNLSGAFLTFETTYAKSSGKNVTVYGLIDETLDFWDEMTIIYNNAPAMLPAADGFYDLDENKVVSLGTFVTPMDAAPVLFSTDPASLDMASFLQSDKNGVVTMILVGADDETELATKEHATATPPTLTMPNASLGGAMDPQPANGATVSPDVSQLCWTLPDPNIPGTILTSDVYFGTTDPNELLPGFGLDRITPDEGITETCIAIPVALEQFKTYYWVVDCTDPSMGEGEQFLPGALWSFNTNNEAPSVDAGQDQYVWLNNAGDPATASVQIDATAADDGLPGGALSVLWTQTSGPEVSIDPADVEDITLTLPGTGTYQFQLTADDTDLTGSDTIQIVVAETPCLAAQAMPGYQAILGDFDNDCIVALNDLAELALHWLECNSLLCP
ncbi:MAG: PKD domain-containing protein [Sedimentisphaerales bacterium]|nr:PKD domain-containing protein [Sedimentisphaerales bacterium]